MARRSYEFKIEGIRYEATTFSGKSGMNRVARLMKLVGPSITKAISSFDTKNRTVQTEALASAAQSLINNMDSDKVVALIDDLLETLVAWEDGKKKTADLDGYFAGEYGVLLQCLFNIINENYSSFFGGSVSNLLNLIPKITAQESD